MRRPSLESIEPAEPLSQTIKSGLAPWANPEPQKKNGDVK